MGCKWYDLGCHARRGVKAVSKGVKKVGQVVSSGIKKVGEIARDPSKIAGVVESVGKLADKALTYAPGLKNIPVVGQVLQGISKADDAVRIGKKLLKGDVRGAGREAGQSALDSIPGVSQAKEIAKISRGRGR